MKRLEMAAFALIIILFFVIAIYSMQVSEQEVQNPHITEHIDSSGYHIYSVNVSDSVNVREEGA